MGNFSSFYLAELPLELQLDTTLGITAPTNPLDTTFAKQANVEDPQNIIRASLQKQINNIMPFAIPTGDLQSFGISNSFLCWLRSNNSEFNDLANDWAEGLKYGLTNTNDLADSDPKTDMKYIIFLEYVRLFTRRYFKRTRESALLDEYIPCSEKAIMVAYKNFRKYYFDTVYKPLRNDLFPTLYSNGTDGFQDVMNVLQISILQPFRDLNVGVTYGVFLTNVETIITNVHDFLISTGPLGQFLVNQYAPQAFAGQNVCKFDDKLNCLLRKFQNIPQSNDDGSFAVVSDNGSGNTASNYVNMVQPNASKYSVITSLMDILALFMLHITDKFVGCVNQFMQQPPATDNMIYTGASALERLYFILYGYTLGGGGITIQFSEKPDLNDTQIDTILGDEVISSPSPNSVVSGGMLKYIINRLRELLSSSTDITLYSILFTDVAPTVYARIGSSFFSGAFQLDWLNQNMADSTVNSPPLHTIADIMTRKPQNLCVNKVSLETELLELMDSKNLDQVLGSYACTYVNNIEGINIPAQSTYLVFNVTGSPITSYNQTIFVDFSISYTSTTPNSYQDFRFLCDCCDSCETIPSNSNIKCFKYYCIALVNYILYAIIRNGENIIPKLVLADLDFPFQTLPSTTFSQYVYTKGSSDTEALNLLFYMTSSWHDILYTSFFGTGKYFDPISIPDDVVCVESNWITTPLIQQLFYLFYIFDPDFLRLMITDITTLSASSSISSTNKNFSMRITNQERITKTNS